MPRGLLPASLETLTTWCGCCRCCCRCSCCAIAFKKLLTCVVIAAICCTTRRDATRLELKSKSQVEFDSWSPLDSIVATWHNWTHFAMLGSTREAAVCQHALISIEIYTKVQSPQICVAHSDSYSFLSSHVPSLIWKLVRTAKNKKL